MNQIIRQKNHRLENHLYQGPHVVSFTICVNDRKELFTTEKIFNQFEDILIGKLNKNNCDAYVYLFMPDHAHILLKGKDDNSDLLKCIKAFKQKTGFWLSKHMSNYSWQKGFYDHHLRKEEDLDEVITYILMNPVRADLVNEWKEYPYVGSTVYDLSKWS